MCRCMEICQSGSLYQKSYASDRFTIGQVLKSWSFRDHGDDTVALLNL